MRVQNVLTAGVEVDESNRDGLSPVESQKEKKVLGCNRISDLWCQNQSAEIQDVPDLVAMHAFVSWIYHNLRHVDTPTQLNSAWLRFIN